MARLIDANEITYYTDEQGFECAYKVDIDNLLTIDPESLRPRAHWEKEMVDGPDVVKYASLLSVFCSRCERRAWTKSNYCPHCGAKMEALKDE